MVGIHIFDDRCCGLDEITKRLSLMLHEQTGKPSWLYHSNQTEDIEAPLSYLSLGDSDVVSLLSSRQ